MIVKPTDEADARDVAHPDGGTPESMDELDETIFTHTSDVPERSMQEKAVRFFDTHIYAPLAVGWNDIRMRIGSLILLLFLFAGTVGPYLIDKPTAMQGPIFKLPFTSLAYPLGTDALGRDLFGMVIHATPAMLKMIASGALLSIGVGTLIGSVSGYKGGTIDRILMTFNDVVLVIPGLALIVVLTSVYPPTDPIIVGLILGIDNWPGLSRTVRSQVLSIREESFTEASRAMGLTKFQILHKDVVTNLMPYISVNLANSARSIIFESVGLYFIGILPFTSLNWGVMLNSAYQNGNMTDMSQLHWILVPMTVIILVSLGFMLFAQGMDRVFNVRLRARHAKTAGGDDDAEAPAQTN